MPDLSLKFWLGPLGDGKRIPSGRITLSDKPGRHDLVTDLPRQLFLQKNIDDNLNEQGMNLTSLEMWSVLTVDKQKFDPNDLPNILSGHGIKHTGVIVCSELGQVILRADLRILHEWVNSKQGQTWIKNLSLAKEVHPHPVEIIQHQAGGDLPWLSRTGLVRLHEIGYQGQKTRIAILDSGVDPNRLPILQSNSDRIVDFVEIDSNGVLIQDTDPNDAGIHGTMLSWIVANAAPQVELVVIKVLNGSPMNERGTIAQLSSGFNWLLENNQRLNVSAALVGLDVSRGAVIKSAIEIVSQMGILPIVSVGNRGPRESSGFKSSGGVLLVGCTDRDGTAWKFSSSSPDIAAPGTDIFVPIEIGQERKSNNVFNGTSFSAAIVAGLFACLESSSNTSLESKYIKNAIVEGASLKSKLSKKDKLLGWGEIDAMTALQRLQQKN